MQLIANPSAQSVRDTPYVSLLAQLGESNLPPGGLGTVRDLQINMHLRPGLRGLHAGCNAGFLSREFARRSGASIIGIDISQDMVESARHEASVEGLEGLVGYERQDVRSLQFADRSFDFVFAGGSLAFVDGRESAVGEQVRVLKEFGLLGDAQFYYHAEPPAELLARIAQIIEVAVPKYNLQYWLDLYDNAELQPYWRSSAPAAYRTDDEVNAYCVLMVERAAGSWDTDAKEELFTRLRYIMRAFNENMKYLSYTSYVYRRVRRGSEPALFI